MTTLARVYLHAYQITGNGFYKRVTSEILDYVAREMTDPNGGIYSSQDADSEGHEGKSLSGRRTRFAMKKSSPAGTA